MNTKLIVANWKMNPESKEKAEAIISEIKGKINKLKSVRIVICPPFVFLNEVVKAISGSKKIYLGAQDLFIGEGVSHTGEISPEMLKNAGVKYIIVGHSEKRELSDTDEIVREKLLGTLKNGFKAILCVGEKERDGHGKYFHILKSQLESAITGLPKKFIKNLIIAYEPVWAIGKSEKEAMKPGELCEMAIFIKRVVSDTLHFKEINKIAVLYGGSVTSGNAKDIVEIGNVNGLLIGRESLKVENFLELVKEIGK
jgi:triosephosphate isomerase